MKILLNVRWPVGGIRTYLRYVYRCFDPAEFELVIVAPRLEETEILQRDLKDTVSRFILIEDATPLRLLRVITTELRTSSYDCIHSHGLGAGLLASIPARIFCVKHILTMHDVFAHSLFAGVRGRTRKILLKIGLRLPDHIHLLGPDLRKNLKEFFPAIEARIHKISIIQSGIETQRFLDIQVEDARDFKSMHGIGDNEKVLAFFGRFMAQKGFGLLVEAIELLAEEIGVENLPVVVACGSGGFLDREKRMLAGKHIEQKILFLPFTPNIAGLLQQVDGVVMPSRWEAFPILPIEVLVSGCPLLASNCIGLGQVTIDTPAFVFESESAAVLSKTIADWLSDSRRSEFQAFRQEAADRFDVRKTAAGLENLYREIGGGSGDVLDAKQ